MTDWHASEIRPAGMLFAGNAVHVALPAPRGSGLARHIPGVRRTCSIDVQWPDGRYGRKLMQGMGRDLLSPHPGELPRVLALDILHAELGPDRSLLAMASTPACAALDALAGTIHAGELRRSLRALRAADAVPATPLFQLADDVPAMLVIADWAWSRWPALLPADEAPHRASRLATLEGVCAGFRTGSGALRTHGEYQEDRASAVPPLEDASDPHAWHPLVDIRTVSMRRARCMEVWRTPGEIRVEAFFQDSAVRPDGCRAAVHEYTVMATASSTTHAITRLAATPHILPFQECESAPAWLQDLVGTPLEELRTTVPALLARTRGCTHLNDALRALAEVPQLLAWLPG